MAERPKSIYDSAVEARRRNYQRSRQLFGDMSQQSTSATDKPPRVSYYRTDQKPPVISTLGIDTSAAAVYDRAARERRHRRIGGLVAVGLAVPLVVLATSKVAEQGYEYVTSASSTEETCESSEPCDYQEIDSSASANGAASVDGERYTQLPEENEASAPAKPQSSAKDRLRVASLDIRTPEMKVKKDSGQWREQTKQALRELDNRDVAVAGLQGVAPRQVRRMRNLTERPGYKKDDGTQFAFYSPAGNTRGSTSSVIAWDKQALKPVKKKTMKIKDRGGKPETVPMVLLQEREKNGSSVWVVNMDNPNSRDKDVAHRRSANNKKVANRVDKLQESKHGVVLLGDIALRLGNKDSKALCQFAQSTDLTHASDAAEGVKSLTGCPPPKDRVGKQPSDHIFVSEDMVVDRYTNQFGGSAGNGSTGPIVTADVVLP